MIEATADTRTARATRGRAARSAQLGARWAARELLLGAAAFMTAGVVVSVQMITL